MRLSRRKVTLLLSQGKSIDVGMGSIFQIIFYCTLCSGVDQSCFGRHGLPAEIQIKPKSCLFASVTLWFALNQMSLSRVPIVRLCVALVTHSCDARPIYFSTLVIVADC